MRSVGADISLTHQTLNQNFPSIPQVSSTPPSDKDLPPVFPASTGEVEPTLPPVQPPTSMTPEQRSESSTVHPYIAETVPSTLGRSTREHLID
ncbi:hypothetical protein AVEN_217612-1 [Araneus ventricosus]|uniref:Uncharacterized protein n=1 Tax=Araneus ventricosus TaxID=182803 RepID=A0A4Y2FGC1_ARAVE|nr:hypothetical protein AVEN_217612-1 [Araneus ventricosus]